MPGRGSSQPPRVDLAEFDFILPPELIAARPASPRDASRLLVMTPGETVPNSRTHAGFAQLGEFLAPGDLLVLNDTRVEPYRLFGARATGAQVECLLLERSDARGVARLRPARKIKVGEPIPMEGGALVLTAEENLGEGRFRVHLAAGVGRTESLEELFARYGRLPLPPYIARELDADPTADRESYQTVFAKNPGAVAAPTAGLHFTNELLAELRERGVETTTVTLHVGEGTFLPVRVDRVEDHEMHSERFVLPESAAAAIAATRARKGRVIAVGTTAARTLETQAAGDRLVRSGIGESRLYMYPGKSFQVIDGLLTNFHLPRSTLLLLVSALAGREPILAAYADAMERAYRFYSYGDAMFIRPTF